MCADADLDLASSGVLWGSFFNAGQTCCSIERIYVTDAVADEFKDQMLAKLGRVQQGDEVGSLTFKNQLSIVQGQVRDALKKGATLLARARESADGDAPAPPHAPTMRASTAIRLNGRNSVR